MRVKMVGRGLMVASLALVFAVQAWAFPDFARQTKAACVACHVSPGGGAALTAAGTAFKADKKAPDTKLVGAEYVGAKKCMMCHIKEHKSWSTSNHAKAFATLKASTPEQVAKFSKALGVEVKDAATSDACLDCHVTGNKLAGGYPAADAAKNATLTAVGCEACHGPGSKHVVAPKADKKKFINTTPSAKMCLQCHTPTFTPKFEFEQMKVKVHPVAAAAAPAK